MNPNLCRLRLRPRDPLEVLDLAFRLMRECWRPMLKLFALVVLPLWVATALTGWWFGWEPTVAAVPIVLSPLLQAPFTVLTGRLLFADQVRIRDVFAEVRERLASLIAAWAMIGVGLTMSACGFLAFIALPAVVFLTETALLERVGPSRGFERSRRLAWQSPGGAFAGVVAWVLLTAWGGLVGEFGGQAICDYVLQLGAPFGSLETGQATPFLLLGLFAAQPLYAIYRLLLYVDVRTRAEGWDLQVALRAAGLGR